MSKKIIIAGGGTGGHIFPAVAIANALKTKEPSLTILFIDGQPVVGSNLIPGTLSLLLSFACSFAQIDCMNSSEIKRKDLALSLLITLVHS